MLARNAEEGIDAFHREAEVQMTRTMKTMLSRSILLASALLAVGALPALSQDNPFAGVWMCRGVMQDGAQVAYQVTLQPNGSYSGTYEASNGYRSYSAGPWRVLGNILRFDFQVWQAYPQTATNPGGDGWYFQFQGPNAMYLFNYRAPQDPSARLACQRMQ